MMLLETQSSPRGARTTGAEGVDGAKGVSFAFDSLYWVGCWLLLGRSRLSTKKNGKGFVLNLKLFYPLILKNTTKTRKTFAN